MKKTIANLFIGATLLSTSAVIISCEGGGDSSSSTPAATTAPAVVVNTSLIPVTGQGPYTSVKPYDYDTKNASIDAHVLAGVNTDVRGRLYVPSNPGSAKLPVIVLLHGNHETCGTLSGSVYSPTSCQWTTTATCEAGAVEIQNHLGYEYLATKLASWGYAVISINANLGITCGSGVSGDSGLNLARGNLILKHLSLFESWSNGTATPPASLSSLPKGQLDFTQVGLLGHSRAGEGVRAAYNLYRDSGSYWATQIPDLKIRAIFEIGPVDGQTSRVLNADGVAWNVILPSCDGDVSDLEGMRPYDRMLNISSETPAPKSMFYVHGANHDFYNTSWQNSESAGCSAGVTPIFDVNANNSLPQQQTAEKSVIPFFRAYVGASQQPAISSVFDPSSSLPSDLTQITQVDRAYYLSPSHLIEFRMENFANAALIGLLGQPHEMANLSAPVTHTTVAEHDSSFMAANVQWTMASGNTYFQDNLSPAGQGFDFSAVQTLDFRIGRADTAAQVTTFNPSDLLDLSIELVYLDNTTSNPVLLSTFTSGIAEPIGSKTVATHYPLQTVRIPMSNFGALKKVHAVRFLFNKTASGSVYIADLGATRFPTFVEELAYLGGASQPNFASASADLWDSPPVPVDHETTRAAEPNAAAADTTDLNVEVYNSKGFPVRDSLTELRASDGTVLGSGGSYSQKGDLRYLTFSVKESDYNNHGGDSNLKVSLHSTGKTMRSVEKVNNKVRK